MRKHLHRFWRGEYTPKGMCFTGAEEAPAAAGTAKSAAPVAESSLGELGINTALPAGTAGGISAGTGFIPSADLAGTAALQGATDVASQGALTGGPIGAGTGPVTSLPGAARGALQGAGTSAVTGGDPIKGAITGGVTGGVTDAINAPSATNLPVGGGSTLPGAGGEAGPFSGDPAAVPKPTPEAPSGISKALSTIGITDKAGGLGPNALPIAALTAGQINANRGAKSAEAQLKALAQPSQTASQQLLAEGTSGQVPPAVMQQFTQTYNDAVAEITQRYANMGRDAKTDSAAQGEIQKAAQARDGQVANYAAGLTSQGLQAAGVAAGPATAAINAGVQSDQNLQNAMSGSLQNMALLAALQKGQTQGAAPGQ